jgi:hypothetical protein
MAIALYSCEEKINSKEQAKLLYGEWTKKGAGIVDDLTKIKLVEPNS